MDPYFIFANYPTKNLNINEKIVAFENSVEQSQQKLAGLLQLSMVNYTKDINLKQKDLFAMLRNVGVDGIILSKLLEKYEERYRPIVYRAVLWLMKFGVLKVLK